MVNTFLMGQMSRYRVVARVVAVKLTSGAEVYLYTGARLPLEASPAHVEHLLSVGLIKEEGK